VSSNEYFAEFRPDPLLYRIVSWSGGLLAVAGLFACMFLALPSAGRIAAGLAWCGVATAELLALRRSSQSCAAFRIMGDGSAAVRGGDGQWQPAALLEGGILLRHCGWLRLRTGAGQVIVQPVRAAACDSADWRRLQVIWRHVGALR
jgi:hypothetical protein